MISKNPLILFVVQHAFLGGGENAARYREKMNDQCFSKTISNHSIIPKYFLDQSILKNEINTIIGVIRLVSELVSPSELLLFESLLLPLIREFRMPKI